MQCLTVHYASYVEHMYKKTEHKILLSIHTHAIKHTCSMKYKNCVEQNKSMASVLYMSVSNKICADFSSSHTNARTHVHKNPRSILKLNFFSLFLLC